MRDTLLKFEIMDILIGKVFSMMQIRYETDIIRDVFEIEEMWKKTSSDNVQEER